NKMSWVLCGVGFLINISTASVVAGGLDEGRKDYQRFCQSCHGNNGSGKVGRAPDFRRPGALLKTDRELVARIEKGKKLCPSFKGILAEEKITNVIRYLRTFR
ncbi:MAG: cytochrome c, partial [Motiliproteus sp.]